MRSEMSSGDGGLGAIKAELDALRNQTSELDGLADLGPGAQGRLDGRAGASRGRGADRYSEGSQSMGARQRRSGGQPVRGGDAHENAPG